MAIYHFSGTIIARSQGRSAVACAAYRSAEKLYDEKYGREHDYTQKKDVASREILLPELAPAWMADREKLWNAVESAEKRKDAQLSREFNFALPHELTLSQNIELAREFVQETFVKRGMVADLCIHNDIQPNGQLHSHAHVMLTMREVTQAGFGKKVREWNDKALLVSWREAWAQKANQHLSLNGHDLQIDHRSLAEQGIELEPQYKIGAAVAKERLARLADHQRIARENGVRLLADPTIALHAITRQQSTFTHHDLARFINRHTADADQFSAVYDKVKTHKEMIFLGYDTQGRERFTTQEMLNIETRMMDYAVSLSNERSHPVAATLQVKACAVKTLSAEQTVAFEHLVKDGGLKCVVGFAGTGKSYLLGSAREAWEAQGYHVQGLTLSGIAAENLAGGSGIPSRTFASRCLYWDKGEQCLTNKDVLVVDEAGMLSSRQMSRIMEEAQAGGAKVVLVGDTQQLQAIEAGAAFRAIADRVQYVELTDIRRQQIEWQREATKDFATNKTAGALRSYAKHDLVHEFETKEEAKVALVNLWNDARLSDPSKTQIMLAYNRNDVLEMNQQARTLLHAQGQLGQEASFQTDRGQRLFAQHDRVYFLKNDRVLGVMNGTLGTIEAINGNALTIHLDQSKDTPGKKVTITMNQYNHLDYGYAATIHKAQGVTIDRSYVLASEFLDAHATYVAMSRHRESVNLFYGRDIFASQKILVDTLSRERPKDTTLDYSENKLCEKQFSHARNIDPISDKSQSYDLHAALMKYVEIELEQTRLATAMHVAKLKSPSDYRKVASEAIKHAVFIKTIAKELTQKPELTEALNKIQKIKPQTLSQRGGFKSIYDRFSRGAFEQEDLHILLARIKGKSLEVALSQSEDRGRRR